jgi:uracil-DNA glycosylase
MDIMIQRSVRGGHAVARDRQFLDETGDGATRHSRLVRMTKSLAELMAPDWAAALAGQEAQIHAMGEFLRSELAAGRGYLPAGDLVLRAFSQPLEDVRVLIVGQDPYPTVGHPIGLSFAVNADVRPLPGSLVNIYRELEADLGVPPCPHGDLSAWAAQGVLLLNRCLTVQPSKPASHRGQGWEQVTQAAIDALIARGGPLVAILWGRDAATVRPQLDAANVPVIVSAHPSPLSARNGFYGSRPFSRANAALAAQGASPINWALA